MHRFIRALFFVAWVGLAYADQDYEIRNLSDIVSGILPIALQQHKIRKLYIHVIHRPDDSFNIGFLGLNRADFYVSVSVTDALLTYLRARAVEPLRLPVIYVGYIQVTGQQLEVVAEEKRVPEWQGLALDEDEGLHEQKLKHDVDTLCGLSGLLKELMCISHASKKNKNV